MPSIGIESAPTMTAFINPSPSDARPGQPPLEPGQRIPNFAVPNVRGGLERIYDRFVGNMVALLIVPSLDGPAAQRELQDLARQGDSFASAATTALALSGNGVADLAAFAERHGLTLPLYADPEARVWRYLAEDGALGQKLATSYLLDRNQRVLTRFAGEGHADRLLAYIGRHTTALPAGRSLAQQAPVLLVPNVFSPDLCDRALAAWRDSHKEGAVSMPERAYAERSTNKPVGAVLPTLKKRLDHIAGDALNPLLMNTAMNRLRPELRKAFHFQVAGIERFCIGAYSAERSDFFRPHRDNVTEMTKDRRFASTIALNDDFDGGGVRFAEFSEDIYNPPPGGALVFSCSLLHEALPITRGTRFAAFTFFFGPDAPPTQRKPA